MSLIDELEQYLDEANIAVLATVGRGSQPHASPVWYQYRDGAFTVIVARDSLKHRDIQANPRVMITLDRREPDGPQRPFAIVMAEGVSELLPSVSRELLLQVASRYMGDERGSEYTDSSDLLGLVALQFRPRKMVLYRGMEKVGEFRDNG